MNEYYPHLFESCRIAGVRYRNRILATPTLMCQITADGSPNSRMIGYYEAKARGGAAQVTVGDTPVNDTDAPGNGLYLQLHRKNLPYLSELSRAIRAHGAVASIELNHSGSGCWSGAESTQTPIGPSAQTREDGMVVREMEQEDIVRIVNDFARSAAFARDAGFNAITIHGGHGWLLGQFLSPLTNHRSDAFGGSLENRARFPLMVIDAVRDAVGKQFPIEFRMSGDELIEGGLTLAESTKFAQMLDGRVDLLHVSAGLDTQAEQETLTHPGITLPHGANVKYAAAIKKVLKQTPVVTVGAISSPEMAEEILARGDADFIGVCRALIADPDLPEKARTGRAEEIRPCLRCMDCLAVMEEREHFSCSVNPCAGREVQVGAIARKITKPQRVLVIGGGPGGMTAAVTASKRGHIVTLAEQDDHLGGLLRLADSDPLKEDLQNYRDYLIRCVRRSEICVRTGTRITPEDLHGYDSVIIAIGSELYLPPIPGIHSQKVCTPDTLAEREIRSGDSVVVLGGGPVGCEYALGIARKGVDVTVVEMQNTIAPTANHISRTSLLMGFRSEGVRTLTETRCIGIESDGALVSCKGETYKLPADLILCALGTRSRYEEAETLFAAHNHAVLIGDCITPRRVADAVREGFTTALDLI